MGDTRDEAAKRKRLEWLEDARFGLFVHWGIYARAAGFWKGEPIRGAGEWIMYSGKIPVAEYERLADDFNPVEFDADEWVRIAKAAGMKYLVITAKHCDGFAMYPSEASSYNIQDATPFGRDPLAELEAACDREGIRLGFYYSHDWDWHEPDALGWDNTWDFPDREAKVIDRFIEGKSLPQVVELVTNYHPHIIWFDVPTSVTVEHSRRFVEAIRSRLPECIINNRVGNDLGDYGTPEQFIPTKGEGSVFEVCMTMNNTWGFKKDDTDWKTPQTIIRNLVDIASKGGNYLLNVGPRADGTIPDASVRVLHEVGRWMSQNRESIHGTSASPLPRLAWGRCTAKPNRLFLHVFEWPESGELYVPGLKTDPSRITLLADPDRRSITSKRLGDRDLVLHLDTASLDPATLDFDDTVIELDYDGDLDVDTTAAIVPEGYPTIFGAEDAELRGEGLEYRHDRVGAERSYVITGWKTLEQSMRWRARCAVAGDYDVSVTYCAAKESFQNRFHVTLGDQVVAEAAVEDSGGWHVARTVSLGRISVAQSNQLELAVEPVRFGGSALNVTLMNLVEVRLTPVV